MGRAVSSLACTAPTTVALRPSRARPPQARAATAAAAARTAWLRCWRRFTRTAGHACRCSSRWTRRCFRTSRRSTAYQWVPPKAPSRPTASGCARAAQRRPSTLRNAMEPSCRWWGAHVSSSSHPTSTRTSTRSVRARATRSPRGSTSRAGVKATLRSASCGPGWHARTASRRLFSPATQPTSLQATGTTRPHCRPRSRCAPPSTCRGRSSARRRARGPSPAGAAPPFRSWARRD